jgi:hypothetical protein
MSKHLLAMVSVLLVGCHSSDGATPDSSATTHVQKGAGIIGTWEGTQTDNSGGNFGIPTHPANETFGPDGKFSLVTGDARFQLTTTGSYSYDDSSKTLKARRETMKVSGGKISGDVAGDQEPGTITWLGSDHIQISIARTKLSFDLTRR